MEEVRLQRAIRVDVFKIAAFLEVWATDEFHVRAAVCTALLSKNDSSVAVYYTPCFAEGYSIIVTVMKKQTRNKNSGQLQNIWVPSLWHADGKVDHQLLRDTDIDWINDPVFFMWGKTYQVSENLEEFLNRLNPISKRTIYPGDVLAIDIDAAMGLRSDHLPGGVYVKSLERCHARIVHENWVFNHTRSVEDVEDDIDQLPSAGLFLKDTDQLVCWMMYHLVFGMGRLFTLPEYRRRGFATLVARYLIKRTIQSGLPPFVVVYYTADVSKLFFKSLGFRSVESVHAVLVSPE